MTARTGDAVAGVLGVVERRAVLLVPALALIWVTASVAVGRMPGGTTLLTLALAGAAALAVAVLGARVAPAHILCTGAVLATLSGNWPLVGMPFGIDRLVVLAGVAATAVAAHRDPDVRWVARPVHLGLLIATGVAFISAVWAGTATNIIAVYAMMDRYGIVPFLAFCAAPYAFREARHRNALVTTLVGLGAYLGATAFFERIGPHALVFPRYILDPNVGLHADRARGPFVESAANGCVIAMCAAACAVAILTWRGRARLWAAIALALCFVGSFLTLTRSAWIALALAGVVILISQRRLWRYALPAGAVAVLAVGALMLLPGVSSQTEARAADESPVWDRANLVTASIGILEDRPLTGIGWARFAEASPEYFRQADTYPQQGEGLVVHNVPLLYATELGLPGFLVWLATAGLALVAPLFLRRRVGRDVANQRTLHAAVLTAWFTVGMFAPLSQALPTLLVFLTAGILSANVASLTPVTARRRMLPVPVAVPGSGASPAA